MNRFIALYAVYVLGMNVIPGPWQRWEKGEYVDLYTVTHVIWGMIAKRMGLSFEELMALAVVNELGEAWLRANRPDLTWGTPETPGNVAVDLMTTGIGWGIG